MKKFIYFLVAMCFMSTIPTILQSQNLIQNGSFEILYSTQYKPHNAFQITLARDWNSAQEYSIANSNYNLNPYYYTHVYGAPDFYYRDTQSNDTITNIPWASPGLFNRNDGLRQPFGYIVNNPDTNRNHWVKGMASVHNYFKLDTSCHAANPEGREYLQQALSTPLLCRHKYHVSFRVSLGNVNGKNPGHFGIKNEAMGALFTKQRVEQSGYTTPPITQGLDGELPQVHGRHYGNGDSVFEYLTAMGGTDGTGIWQIIEGIVSPVGSDYNYITIGCFLDSVSMNDFRDANLNPPQFPYSSIGFPCTQIYYFIDSIQVYQIDSEILIDCCDSISVAANEPTTDSLGRCCYTFNVSTTDSTGCTPTALTIYEVGTMNQWQVSEPVMGNNYPSNGICITQGSGQHHYMFAFTNPCGDTCQKHVFVHCPPPINCCDSITVTSNALWPDANGNCCYNFFVSTKDTGGCKPDSLSIYEVGTLNQWHIGSPEFGHYYPNVPICISTGSGVHHIRFVFNLPNSDSCEKVIDISCPFDTCCPPNRDEWLTTEVVRDTSCGFGCRVFMTLDIPDTIGCFTKYFIDYNGQSSVIFDLSSHPVWQNSYCIGDNSSSYIAVHLFNDDFSRECLITRTVSCDSTIPQLPITAFNCTPSCPDSVWKTDYIRIDIYPGCSIDVTYSYRQACDGYQDFQINKMTIIGNCGGSLPKEIFQNVVDSLIVLDPMGFAPKPGTYGCNDFWRLINGSCSKWSLEHGIRYTTNGEGLDYTKLVIIPCSDSCCFQRYRVCRYIDRVTVDTLGPVNGITPIYCPMIPDSLLQLPPDSLGIPKAMFKCHQSCDWLLPEHGGIVIGVSHKESFELQMINEIRDYQCNIKSGFLEINNQSRENSRIKLEVYDILGNLVNQNVKTSNSFSIKLDISSLIQVNGVYMYRVYLNDMIYCTGKFIK